MNGSWSIDPFVVVWEKKELGSRTLGSRVETYLKTYLKTCAKTRHQRRKMSANKT